MPDTGLLTLFREPIVLVGLALLVLLKGVDVLQRERHRQLDRNGSNPVVNAIDRLAGATDRHNEAMLVAHKETRELIRTTHDESLRACREHFRMTEDGLREIRREVHSE